MTHDQSIRENSANVVGKVLKLPKCRNNIVIPLRSSSGGYVCNEIRDFGEIVSSGNHVYIREDIFDDAIDLTDVIKSL
jgi:hypothetical protein